MKCPKCGFDNNRVIDTQKKGVITKRIRECLTCGKRFTTTERILKNRES